MSNLEKDVQREDRINMEILVDVYDEDHYSLCWHSYLDRKLNFPFQALLANKAGRSPEQVEIVGMSSEEECEDRRDMLVDVAYDDDSIPTPLREISAPDADPDTQEAIADWHYWIAMGYEL
jgi:hypothetical protein